MGYVFPFFQESIRGVWELHSHHFTGRCVPFFSRKVWELNSHLLMAYVAPFFLESMGHVWELQPFMGYVSHFVPGEYGT